jgi:hypothetical protein
MAPRVSLGRVRLIGTNKKSFYMPALLGANPLGKAAEELLKENEPPAVALGPNLFLRGRCVFKVAQCLYHP